MSSHQESYDYPEESPTYYESGSESPVARQHSPSVQSWPSTVATDDRISWSQPHQSLDPTGNLLEVHGVENMNHPFNYPDSSYPLPSTSSQDPGVETGATYTNDNIPSHSLINLPYYPYTEFGDGLSQHQHGYISYNSVYDATTQPLVHDVAYQRHASDVHTPQTSQGSFAHVHPPSPTLLLPMVHGGHLYRTDTIPDRLTVPVADTAMANVGSKLHSHSLPVATSPTNQPSGPGPSRQPPSSPERKRLLPLTAAEEFSTARRVVPRHDGAHNVHSMSSESPGRSRSNSDAYGRGPLIPQERYTTSTISSFNSPNSHPIITFNLENPNQIGTPVIDILNKTDSFARIRDRTHAFNMGKKTFTLRVQWPGYKPWSKTIAAMDWTKSRAPITRVKLAEAVATAIRDLFEKYHDQPYDPEHAAWNVGRNGIQLNQICLLALHQVSRGSWQPQLCLLEPRP